MNYPNEYTNAAAWHRRGITGKGVVVAVVDTGVAKHPDMDMLPGYAVAGGGGADSDASGHGTHVAGIAAGKRYGVAPGAKILPVKICRANSAGTCGAYIAGGLKWLIEWKKAHSERLVANISYHGTSDPRVAEQIARLTAMDVPVCVCAGNNGGERSPIAEYDSPIVAGNLEDENTLDDTSTCWGELTDCAVIGSHVWSCAPTGGYVPMSGTSMAAPAVAGMLALILSRWPDMSEQKAYEYLMSLCRHSVPCGGGHEIPVPVFSDDFPGESESNAKETERDKHMRETKYIAGVGEGKALIVREGAGAGSEKAGNLANGDMVTVLGAEGAKSLVAAGTCGWIPSNYLVDEPPVSTGKEDTAAGTDANAGGSDDVDIGGVPDEILCSEIGQLQELLYKWGFGAMVGGIDGILGPKTKQAIQQFQSAMGLGVDGIAGPKTLAKLKGEAIVPRITEEDMRCMCGKYCDGMPNPSTAGVRLLIERIWREHEKTRPGVVYCITNRETPAPDKAIAGGQRCAKWNAERGGASGSQHKYGRGADIMPKLAGVADATLRQECEDIALRLNTKGGVGYGARYIVHVDVRGTKARWKY